MANDLISYSYYATPTSDLLFRSTNLLVDLVNPTQLTITDQRLQQQGQTFQFTNPNWNIVKTDDFGDLLSVI